MGTIKSQRSHAYTYPDAVTHAAILGAFIVGLLVGYQCVKAAAFAAVFFISYCGAVATHAEETREDNLPP